jgi:hypothetical protein
LFFACGCCHAVFVDLNFSFVTVPMSLLPALRYFKTTSKLRAGTQLRLPKAVDPERLKQLAAAADAANKAAIACAARAKSKARAKAKAAKAAAAAEAAAAAAAAAVAAVAPPLVVTPTAASETAVAAAVGGNVGGSESGEGVSSAASAGSAEQNAATAVFAAASTLPALPDDAVVKAEPQMTQLMGKTIPAPPVSAPPNH